MSRRVPVNVRKERVLLFSRYVAIQAIKITRITKRLEDPEVSIGLSNVIFSRIAQY